MATRFDKSLPTTLVIGYRTISLLSKPYDADLDDQMGQYDTHLNRLTVRITGNGPMDVNTILHETMHVMYEQYDLANSSGRAHDIEERVVNSLANGITELLGRNPKLVEWIAEKLDD